MNKIFQSRSRMPVPDVFTVMQKIPRGLARLFTEAGVEKRTVASDNRRRFSHHVGGEIRPSARAIQSGNLLSVADLREQIQTYFRRFLTNLWLMEERHKIEGGETYSLFFLFLEFEPIRSYRGLGNPEFDRLVAEALSQPVKEVRSFVIDEGRRFSIALYPEKPSCVRERKIEPYYLPRRIGPTTVGLEHAYALADSA